ncbi:MAG: MCE family protein [Anaerolineae bacterium]|nr:MCE family protein [Phycisphaerae bacterium]
MASERNSLKAGLFIVISVAMIVAIVIGIKGLRRFIEPSQRHQVRFTLSDDIGGLADGDPVRIGGANVGTVRDIELDTDSDNPGIVITFAIPRKFKIHKDAVLTVQSNLTGVSVLNFESLGGGQMLVEGETLAGKPGASFSALAAVATAMFGDARTTTLPKVNTALDKASNTIDVYKGTGENATELVKYLRSKIDPVIDRYNAVADKGAFAMNEIGSLFGDTKADIRGTMSNLNTATGSLKERMPGILEKVDGTLTKISVALDDTNAALADIKKVAENTRDATGSARSILTTNRSRIDAMIVSAKTAADNLKFATAEIRRSPWRLLYKPAANEMANLNLYDSARQFADGAGSMSDAAEALRDALKDPDAQPERIQKLVNDLDEKFQTFNKVESELWKQVKE